MISKLLAVVLIGLLVVSCVSALTFTTNARNKVLSFLNQRNYTYDGKYLNFSTVTSYYFDKSGKVIIITLRGYDNHNWTFMANRASLNRTLGGLV